MGDRSLHCRNRHFWHFGLLWPWLWADDLTNLTRTAWRILDVQIWTSYVKAFESYRLTDIHTYIIIQADRQNLLKL